MKRKIIILGMLLSYFTGKCQVLEENKTENTLESPFQVSFIYPIGSNGALSYERTNNLSINILMGYNGGVNGIETGGFLNINEYDVKGLQMAGFGNLNGGGVNGIQLSGFANINNGKVNGVQGAGFINVNNESEELIQLAGFANITGNFNGIQGSGFINVADNIGIMDSINTVDINISKKGAQFAGFANIAKDVEGIQGAGFINVAKNVKGLQLSGFINICDSIEGLPIGVISIVKHNGFRKISIWSNETFYINTSYKIGVERFYTIFNLGIRPEIGTGDWSTGIGFGTALSVKNNNFLDIELMQQNLFNLEIFEDYKSYGYHNLNQIKTSFRHRFSNNFQIFAGPSFNLLISNNETKVKSIIPSWALKNYGRYNTVFTWFGFNTGLQF